MTNTVIAVYDKFEQAQAASKKLLASNFTSSQVHLRPSDDTPSARQSALRALDENDVHTGEKSGTLRSFFHDLFGGDSATTQDHSAHYDEAVQRGGFMLAVDATDDHERDVATSVMEQFQPIDLEERAAQWRNGSASKSEQSGTAASLSQQDMLPRGNQTAPAGKDQQQVAIPVIEEELKVGKREVQRGGVRVFQRVTETPVHESIGLREEHVSVERHAVDQPVTAADLESLKQGTLEVREMAEEAVVSKTARVVEEVVVRKEVSEREATINDTVRRTDVEVEKIDASTHSPGSASNTDSTGAGTKKPL